MKLLATLAACSIAALGASRPSAGMADQPYRLDIPAQDLGSALKAFSAAVNEQVLYSRDVVAGLRSTELKGEFTSKAAILILLKGSGLQADRTSSGVLLIRRPGSTHSLTSEHSDDPGTADTGSPNQGKGSSDGFRMAQETAGQPQSDTTVEKPREQSDENRKERAEPYTVNTPEVLVVGSRITNVDVQRTEDDVQPYTILDSQQIQQSGAVSVEDFLKQRLTMNTTIQSNSQVFGSTLATTSTINLRGLGSNETLVLINGRRSAGTASLGTDIGGQTDVNAIPLSAIERIEVLPSSASSIYGGAAVGGVVNIILKRKYEGGDLSYTFENTFNANAPIQTLNATYGFSINENKTQVMLAGHYSNADPVLYGERMGLIDQGYSHILKNDPSFFTSGPAAPILGATPNIGSADGVSDLTLKSNGASLNSPIASMAPGAAAATSSTIIPSQWNTMLAPTAQQTGLELPMGSVPRIKSFMASIRQEITSKLDLFTEFSTMSNIGTTHFDPFDTSSLGGGPAFVPASSPANPFSQDVSVSYPDSTSVPLQVDSVTQSATVGAVARLPGDWSSELDYTWSRNSFEYDYYGYDYTALPAALAAGTINPFVDTLAHPLNLSPYLVPTSFSGRSSLNDVGLRASGPVGSFSWGRPTLTIGLEHRTEASDNSDYYETFPLTPGNTLHQRFFGQSQSINSVYAEALIPLVTASNALPGLRSLDLQIAGRSERYTVHTGTPYEILLPVADQAFNPPQGVHKTIEYTSTNPTVGFKYKPIEDFAFRASYAEAFLPPTTSQLLYNPTPSTYTVPITDPQNGQTYGVREVCCGNPNLKPQTSQAWNLGVIYEPKEEFLQGLRLNLEYYKITQPNYITLPTPQQIVSNAAYASRVTRDPATGRITVVDVGVVNAAHYKTNGWDLTIDYDRSTSFGAFALHALGTAIVHDQRQYTIGGPFAEFAGYPADGGEGTLSGNATLTWTYLRWTLGWTTTHFGSYWQSGSPGSPSAIQNGAPNTLYTNAQGAFSIPSQTYHDIFGTYTYGKSPLSHLTIQFGVKNLFNSLPPFDAYYGPYYYSPYGNPRLRAYWISVRKNL